MKLPARSPLPRSCLRAALVAALASVVMPLAGCGGGSSPASGSSARGAISAVAAENEYANVLEQVGGRYVRVTAVETNPNTDPHAYEASVSTARAVAGARLLVENGAGYDSFMGKIESAAPNAARKVINVQKLLGLPSTIANPHLWYRPGTMGVVARAIAGELSALEPAHAAYFRAHAATFEASLKPWLAALAGFAARHPRTTVATTEPVANYMLEAAGVENLTPFALQADLMNGTDPAPQNVSLQMALLSAHKVKVLIENGQVTNSATESFVNAARAAGIPVVGASETMPTPGYSYQSWMLAEVRALERALSEHVSTEKL